MDYKINVNRLKENENSNIKAFATVVFGESFKVSSIAIMDGKNGLYVQMPRYRTNDTDAEEEVCIEISAILLQRNSEKNSIVIFLTLMRTQK